MYTRKDLTKAILHIPLGAAQTAKNAPTDLTEVLKDMVRHNQQVYVELVRSSPAGKDVALCDLYKDENAHGLKMYYSREAQEKFRLEKNESYFVIAYTGARFFRRGIENISLVGFPGVLYAAAKTDKCMGVIFNPQSAAELYLFPPHLVQLLNEYSEEHCYDYRATPPQGKPPLFCSGEDFTDAILKSRRNPFSDEANARLLEILQDLYLYPLPCLLVASSQTASGRIAVNTIYNEDCPLAIQRGEYIVAFSEEKYFRSKFGKGALLISTKELFDTFSEMYHREKCKGIVVNPETDAEMYLSFITLFAVFDELGIPAKKW